VFRPTSLLWLLVAGGVAIAQNPPPVPPAAGAAPLPVRLQFPNTDVKEVLGFYERLSNKRLVIDNQVQGTVNIVVAGNVSPAEAMRIIEINLILNGFTLVPVDDGSLIKVIGGGKNPRTAAIPIISDELMLPQGEQVVTFVIKLRYADPAKLAQTLGTFIVQAPGNYTNITALPESQALVITENSAVIRGVLRLVREIDVPPAEVISEFVALERADATDVLQKLVAIFEKKNDAATPSPTGRATARPPGAPGAPAAPGAVTAEVVSPGSVELSAGALSEDSVIVGKIKLTADVRTNRIHVVTRPVNMPFVRKLITEFDSSAKFGEPVSRPLRWIPVSEVLDVVVKSITEPGVKVEDGGGAARPASGGGSSARTGGTSSGFGGGTGSGSGGGEFSVSEGLSTEPVDTTPEARVVGTTKIIADKNANAIIVIGGEDVKAKVFRLLEHLDQRIPQVMLHTVIGELNLNEKEQFGVDYILRSNALGISPIVVSTPTTPTTPGGGTGGTGNDGTGTGSSTSQPSSIVAFSNGAPVLNLNNLLDQNKIRAIGVAGGSGLTGFVTAGNTMTAVVTALENTNRFRVVSRPSVFTRNNKKAIIASGQEIAVPTSIQSALNSGNDSNGIVTNSSVQFKRVALQLEVVPLINSDREVSLEILQKVDEVSGSTRIDNNDIPNIATRYVKTSVSVPNEGTLVLGGLIKQSMNRGRTGIPILGNLPLLGPLFSTTTKEKIRTELVILIRPVVSWAPPESIQIRERAQEFLNMDPDVEATLFPRSTGHVAPSEVPVAKAIAIKKTTVVKKSVATSTPAPKKAATTGARR
jgi:general secretion pathway protein D